MKKDNIEKQLKLHHKTTTITKFLNKKNALIILSVALLSIVIFATIASQHNRLASYENSNVTEFDSLSDENTYDSYADDEDEPYGISSSSSSSRTHNSYTSDTHYCEVSGCNNKGKYTVTGLGGNTEYYCYTHYKEMNDIVEDMHTDVYGTHYDESDPYYRKNDVNNDGRLTDEEFQNALGDFLDDIDDSGVLDDYSY